MFNSFMMVLPLVICIAAGYAFKRIGMLNDEGSSQMGRIVYYLATPCILFRLTITLRAEDLSNVGFIVIFYTCLLISMLIWTVILHFNTGDVKNRATSYLMILRTNNLFMGIPTIIMLWGEAALKTYALFIALSVAFIEITSLMFALATLSGEIKLSSVRHILKTLITNPVVLSLIAGTAWGLGIAIPLPSCIDLPMKIFGDLGTGLALMSLGMKLDLQHVVGDLLSAWQISIMRLIVTPLIVWTGFKLFPATPELVKMSLLIMFLPIAANTTPTAEALGMDGDYAAHAVMASTLLSILTLPVMVNILL